MKRDSLGFVVVLFTCACARFHPAPGPVLADRPGFGDAPDVLPIGALQIEAGFTDDRAEESRYQSAGELLMRVGIGGGVELRLFGNSYAARSAPGQPAARGFENSKIGAKVSLIDQPDSVRGLTPNLSLLFAATLPTGAHAFGARVALPELQLAAGWSTSSAFSFSANAGLNSTFDDHSWSIPAWTSAGLSYDARPGLSLFAEGVHEFDAHGSAPAANTVDGGITWLARSDMQIDARIGRRSSRDMTGERIVGFGIVRRF